MMMMIPGLLPNQIDFIIIFICFLFQVVKMMMGVVSLFLVCWLPYHTYFITANVYPAINYTHYIQVIIINTMISVIFIIIIIILIIIMNRG